jgi:hypothetical protein
MPPAPERLAAAVARLITTERPIGGRTPALGAAVLAGSLECGVANRVILVDIAGETEAGGSGWRCEDLALVVEAASEGRAFEDAVRAEMAADGPIEEGVLDLPGGLSGRWLAVRDRPDWRRVEIAVGGGWTVVGLGKGAAASWRAPAEGMGSVASLQRTARGQEEGKFAVEMMVDLDRLRSSVPERFSQQRAGRILEALGLTNARAFSVGVTASDPGGEGMPLQVAWTARSEPAERAVARPLPGSGLVAAPDGWSWAFRSDVNLKRAMGNALAAVRAWRTPFGMMEFDRGLERWSKTDAGRRALGAISVSGARAWIGTDADGRLRGRLLLAGASPENAEAAIGSLPGAVERQPGPWEVPALSVADDPGGVLRALRFAIGREGEGVTVEVGVASP